MRLNAPALAAEYFRKFGNEISTDNAREIVSPEYAAGREARTQLTRATRKSAAALSDHLFEEALKNPDSSKPRVVIMTAGGTGAGKTSVLRGNPDLAGAQLVYDSNLSSKKSSVARIESARAAGNRVMILFVKREPVEALTGGVLPRAMEEGRIVDLGACADASGRSGEFRASDPEIRQLSRRAVHCLRQHAGARPRTQGLH